MDTHQTFSNHSQYPGNIWLFATPCVAGCFNFQNLQLTFHSYKDVQRLDFYLFDHLSNKLINHLTMTDHLFSAPFGGTHHPKRPRQVLRCQGWGQMRTRRLPAVRGEHDRGVHAERQALRLGRAGYGDIQRPS